MCLYYLCILKTHCVTVAYAISLLLVFFLLVYASVMLIMPFKTPHVYFSFVYFMKPLVLICILYILCLFSSDSYIICPIVHMNWIVKNGERTILDQFLWNCDIEGHFSLWMWLSLIMMSSYFLEPQVHPWLI